MLCFKSNFILNIIIFNKNVINLKNRLVFESFKYSAGNVMGNQSQSEDNIIQ